MSGRFLIQLFFCALWLANGIYSQQRIKFDHLTMENGLSFNAVTCILQDSKGFMWFGTQDGLNRYDGYNFKVFKSDPADSSSLTDNFIFSIYESDSGLIYIETISGTFHQYIRRNESFAKVDPESIDLSNAEYNSVLAKFEDKYGIVWTGGLSKETGLIKRDKSGEILAEYKHDPADPSSISSDKVYSILRDKSGVLWIGTANGLDRFDEQYGKFKHYRHDQNNPESISYNFVWPVFEDSEGNFWVGTFGGGLNYFDRDNGIFTSYKNNESDESSLGDDYIYSIYEDRSGLIWIGTGNSGVSYFDPSSRSFEYYTHIPNNPNSFSSANIQSIHVDRSGIIWAGSENGGLNRFDKENNIFTNFAHDPSNSNSPASNKIAVITQDNKGMIWLGTMNDGLDSFNPKTKIFKHYTHNPYDSNSLSDNRVYALLEDKNGILWIGTYGEGLNSYNAADNTFKHYKHDPEDLTSISGNAVWSILEDASGNLWVGTFGEGLNLFNPASEAFTHYKNNPEDVSSLSDNSIVCLYEDSRGILWIGTLSGLNRFDEESGTFKHYSVKDGLPNNIIFGILEDDGGNLWMSTANGLSRFNPEEETFVNYYHFDGLQGNDFNQNSYSKNRSTGELLFGGINGMTVFHPDNIKATDYVPPIVFTDFIRYNTDDKEGKPIVETGIDARERINLTYKDNIAIFQFIALSYHNSYLNEYSYKLEGFNDNWIQLGTQRRVTFTSLAPGDYTLRVRGSNYRGIWNYEGASLSVTVIPPWWRTNIAYALYVLFGLGFLYSVRRFEINRREQKARVRESELRIKATEAEKRALEADNKRKTQELEDARKLQLSMLPETVPDLPDYDIGVFMRTATEVGGDYYDFTVEEDGTLNVAFGDATGHGLQAGIMVTLMKGFFTSNAVRLGIEEFMNHSSRSIKEIKMGRMLMSFTFMKIRDKKMYLTSAGMPPVYFFSSNSETIEEISMKGMPLGAMANFPYRVYERELKPGDTILFLTDGLPEQMNKDEEMFDYIRVKERFVESAEKSPQEIIEHLISAGDRWMDGASQEDDITFVVVKVK